MAPKLSFQKNNLHNIMKQGEDEKLLQSAQLLGKVLASTVMLRINNEVV